MELKGKFKVLEIKQKTQAVFFKDLKVGDEFELVYNLNGSYGYAPYISIFVDGKHIHSNSAVQLSNNLRNFTVIGSEG